MGPVRVSSFGLVIMLLARLRFSFVYPSNIVNCSNEGILTLCKCLYKTGIEGVVQMYGWSSLRAAIRFNIHILSLKL